MNAKTILMIEDNPEIMSKNRAVLEMEGYRVLEAGTLAKGRELMETENPDLILLDILLPDGNGLDYCRELRGESGVSILFLSALNTTADTVAGLRAGGDDYITKPYKNEELLARIEVLLRRRLYEPPLHLGALELRFSPRGAYLSGENMLLTPMEFNVLEYLTRRAGHYITALELYERVWDMKASNDLRTVHNHIYSLRRKLGGHSRVVIEQKRGLGYMISATS